MKMEKKTKKDITEQELFDPKTGKFRRVGLLAVGETPEDAEHNLMNTIIVGLKTALQDEDTRNALLNGPDRQQILNKLFRVHEDRVLDEDFFKFIQEEPSMLGSTFAQEKIERWRRELNADDVTAFKAQEKLEKIGRALIPESFRGKDKSIETILAFEKYHISRILQDGGIDFSSRETVRELFGDNIANDDRIFEEISQLSSEYKLTPRRCAPLAEKIVAKQQGLSLETIKTYVKRVRVIMNKNGKPVFMLKKPKDRV
jgi:hypothetical protein